MVRLSRIYTRTGDGGQTRLGDNSQVAKTDARVEAFGCVDELNAVLGLALSSGLEGEQAEAVRAIQNDLFDLGADLSRPMVYGEKPGEALRIGQRQVAFLEGHIDRINASLQPLRSFVLPGGRPAAAWLHLARATCRRAERRVWALAAREPLNPQMAIYLNRLSDLLFVMARHANGAGAADVLWQPGRGLEDGA